ncbi:phenylalanyl-tRNA synthetase subunit beta [Klebsiella michiganensis]|nr:phenylalanyl-tRNA synthetase subunit beta [Klebsiella michiganensis]
MKFSELWLREWVNPAIDSEALSDQITMAGLEVDGVEPVAGSFNGVVVGEVVECAQHPNADKLRVTKINVGGERLLDIVCGAPNCRQGLKVAVATIGAVLPGDFKIKAAKLRGEPSEGMLCSFSELGISDDHSGIIELPADAPLGTDIREYLKLDDNTIEISVTAEPCRLPGYYRHCPRCRRAQQGAIECPGNDPGGRDHRRRSANSG